MVGVEQRAERGGWMQKEPAGGRFGDQQHSVTGRETAGSAHADREAQIFVVADAGRRVVGRDDEDGAGDQGQGERVAGPPRQGAEHGALGEPAVPVEDRDAMDRFTS